MGLQHIQGQLKPEKGPYMSSKPREIDQLSLDLARRVMDRAAALGQISEEPGRLTRRFATSAMKQANELVAGWMREAGMHVRESSAGNLVGRYESETQVPTLILGSHLDTVRDAGKYDGPLGVLVAIACVERLRAEKRHLPFAVEVVAFADEEGLRYHTSYLGSRAYTGAFDPALLDLTGKDGVAMRDAIRSYGGDPEAMTGEGRSPEDLIGYCEVHIEQGPVLEREGLPVGVVSAISGQTRASLLFRGEAGHAGTVPMEMRRDALCAAAEFILAAESLAKEQPGLVATVGQIQVGPGASNVIPGQVAISLDVRHMKDAARRDACVRLREMGSEICARRGVDLEWSNVQENASVPCDSRLTDMLAGAVESLGYPALRLPSGAGHDGVSMAQITRIAMLFVRCERGISHNPAESVAVEDVSVAICAIDQLLYALSEGL